MNSMRDDRNTKTGAPVDYVMQPEDDNDKEEGLWSWNPTDNKQSTLRIAYAKFQKIYIQTLHKYKFWGFGVLGFWGFGEVRVVWGLVLKNEPRFEV